MIKLAAFDIAGTTVNDRHLVYDALRDCVANDGVAVEPSDLAAAMGTRKDHAIAQLLKAAGRPHDDETVAGYFAVFVRLLDEYYTATPPVAIDGAEEAIGKLREQGVKVALTTGFSRDIAGTVLGHCGWSVGKDGTVDALVCSDEVAAGRPAPHLIHRAMERTGVHSVREVLAAGDTVADLRAGTNSGASLVVGVLTGPTPESALVLEPHTHIVPSVAEVPRIISEYHVELK